HCVKGGQVLPHEVAFCSACGQAQQAGLGQAAQEPQAPWETCEIMYRVIPHWTYNAGYYWVEAVSPRGVYTVAQTEEIGGPPGQKRDQREHDAVASLVNKLIGDGWEPLTRGEHAYSHRFRRRAT